MDAGQIGRRCRGDAGWIVEQLEALSGTVVLRNRPFATGFPMVDPAIGGWAGVFVIAFPDDVVDGHRVLFVEPDPKVQGLERPGSRLANLFVGPAAAAP